MSTAQVLAASKENIQSTGGGPKKVARVETLLVKKLSDKAVLPKRGSDKAAGYDLVRSVTHQPSPPRPAERRAGSSPGGARLRGSRRSSAPGLAGVIRSFYSLHLHNRRSMSVLPSPKDSPTPFRADETRKSSPVLALELSSVSYLRLVTSLVFLLVSVPLHASILASSLLAAQALTSCWNQCRG